VTFTIYAVVGSDIFQKHKTLQMVQDKVPVSRGIRSVTVNVTTTAAEAMAIEPATPYSTCIESQQSQSGSGVDAQINKNNVMWGYLRYSFLFFIAMVVTWV
jgi:hypothetical protein